MSNSSYKVKNESTAAEIRLMKDLNEVKNNRLTTNKFKLELSNIIKDEEKKEFTLCVKLNNILEEEFIYYNVIKNSFVILSVI